MNWPAVKCRPIALLAVSLLTATTLRSQLPVARLAHLLPAGGKAGSQIEVTAAGGDLDAPAQLYFSHAGITATPKDGKFTVTIASNVPPGVYDARFVGRFGISNPRAFVVGTLPEFIAPATNTAAANAIELLPNATINSRVQPDTAAWFKFTARQGQRLFIECLSDNLDSRMDATVGSPGTELEFAL